MKRLLFLFLFCFWAIAQQPVNSLDQSTLDHLKKKNQGNETVDLSPLEKIVVGGKTLTLKYFTSQLEPKGCRIKEWKRNNIGDEWWLTRQRNDFQASYNSCAANRFSGNYVRTTATFVDAPYAIWNSRPISIVPTISAECILDQMSDLKNILEKSTNRTLLTELDVNEVRLEIQENSSNAFDESKLTFGLRVSNDPILTVTVIVNSKGTCFHSSEAAMEETFIRWDKDSRLEEIRAKAKAAAKINAKKKSSTANAQGILQSLQN